MDLYLESSCVKSIFSVFSCFSINFLFTNRFLCKFVSSRTVFFFFGNMQNLIFKQPDIHCVYKFINLKKVLLQNLNTILWKAGKSEALWECLHYIQHKISTHQVKTCCCRAPGFSWSLCDNHISGWGVRRPLSVLSPRSTTMPHKSTCNQCWADCLIWHALLP